MLAPKPTGWARAAVLAPALIVGAAAVAATAHGGYEVAVASGVPEGLIAALYPLITDGLALVAYAATHRLAGAARGYAWIVVVLAAALSGLAQAVYLVTGPGLVAPAEIRFGVGAWPAAAGAVAAHLVFLLAQKRPQRASDESDVEPSPVVLLEDETPALVGSEPTPAPTFEEVAEAVQVRALRLAPNLAPTPPRGIPVVPPIDEDEVTKAKRLLAAGTGRTVLMRELDLKDHQAKNLRKASNDEIPSLLARYRSANA